MLRGLSSGRIPIAAVRAELARRPVRAVPGVPAGLLGQVVRFAAIGVASTLAFAVLYLLLRTVLDAQTANLLALATTAVGNTAANRVITFGVRGSDGLLTHHATGLLAFAVALGLTSGSLAALHLVAPDAARWVELGVLAAGNAVATAVRFVALKLVMGAAPGERGVARSRRTPG